MKIRTRKARAMQKHRLNDGWISRRLWLLHHLHDVDATALGYRWGCWVMAVRYDTETERKVLAEVTALRARPR